MSAPDGSRRRFTTDEQSGRAWNIQARPLLYHVAPAAYFFRSTILWKILRS